MTNYYVDTHTHIRLFTHTCISDRRIVIETGCKLAKKLLLLFFFVPVNENFIVDWLSDKQFGQTFSLS